MRFDRGGTERAPSLLFALLFQSRFGWSVSRSSSQKIWFRVHLALPSLLELTIDRRLIFGANPTISSSLLPLHPFIASFLLILPHLSSDLIYSLIKSSSNVIAGVAGITADANSLINYARNAAQRYLLAYDDDIPVEQLAQRLCDLKQGYTQYGGESWASRIRRSSSWD